MNPRTAAFILASLLSLAIASDLLWMPVQVFDSLDEILDAQASSSAWASFEDSLRSDESHVRPLRVAQTKLLYDFAGGEHYWLVYRGFHAALLVTAILLFTAAQRVSTGVDLAASAFALVVLVGMRTFRGNVQEAFPINHFLEILVCCLLTLNLARSGPSTSLGRLWVDAVAVLTFVAAVLTLESGLLVWVVAAGAWIVGWRGVSLRAIAMMTLLVGGYAYLRLAVLGIDTPALPDRSTGFLLATLDSSELQQRFGDRPFLLHAYNVAASALSVLFSEPSNGVFVTIRGWLAGDLLPRLVIPIITSSLTTLLIVLVLTSSIRRRHGFDDTWRWVVLMAIVLGANAALSFSYTKDEMMGVAGAFYALAAFAAMRIILQSVQRAPKTAAAAAIVLVVLLTAGWSVRAAGLHYLMRSQAFKHQNDWVRTPGEWKRQEKWPDDPSAQQLIRQLHDAAVHMEAPNPGVGEPRWVGRLWED